MIGLLNKKDKIILCDERPTFVNIESVPIKINVRTYNEYAYTMRYFSKINNYWKNENSNTNDVAIGLTLYNNKICEEKNKNIISAYNKIYYAELTTFSQGIMRHPASIALVKNHLTETKEHEILHAFINSISINCMNLYIKKNNLSCHEIEDIYGKNYYKIRYIQNFFDEIDLSLY